MADFEFYTKNVPLEPAPIAQVPRETVGSVLGQALSSVGESVAAKGFRVQKEVGLEKASEAGSAEGGKLGFVPKEAKTEQDIVFNKAALQAQKMAIQNDVRSKVMGIQQDVLSNSNLNSVNEYNARVQNYAKSILPTISPALQDYTKNNIEYYGLTHKAPVVSEVDSLHRNMVQSNIQLSYNNGLRDATNAAFQGNDNAAKAQRAEIIKNLDAGVNTGNVTGSYRTQSILALDKSLKFSRYLGDFNNHLVKNKTNEFIDNFIKTDQKDLLPGEKQQLLTSFRGMLNEHKQAIIAQYGNLDNKVNDLATSIYLSGTNSATIGQVASLKSKVNDLYSSRPDKAKELNRTLDFAIERNGFNNSTKWSSPTDIQSRLLGKQKELKAAPIEGKTQKTQEFSQLAKDAERTIRDRKVNLYDIVSQNPAVIAATNAQRNANQSNVSMTTGAKLGAATVSSIQDRDEMMIQTEKGMGIHPSDYEIVAPKKIQALVGLMQDRDAEHLVNGIQTILQQHQGHANVAMNQLQQKIPGFSTMLFNGILNPATSARTNMLLDAANNSEQEISKPLDPGDVKSIKDNVSDIIMEEYGATLLNKNGDPTKILGAAIDYTRKLALVYKRDGIANPEETAFNDALGAHVQIDTYNGRRFMIPNNTAYSANDIKIATAVILEGLEHKKLVVPLNFRQGRIPSEAQKSYKTFLSTDAYPAMTENNDGIVILDGAKQPVKTVDGDSPNARLSKEAGFSFKNLINPNSEVNKQISKSNISKGQRFSNILTNIFGSGGFTP